MGEAVVHTDEFHVDDPKSEQGPLVGTVLDGRTCKPYIDLLVHSCEYPEPVTRIRLRTRPALHDSLLIFGFCASAPFPGLTE